MKRLYIILFMLLAVAIYATSDNRVYKGTENITFTTDDGGDSTISTGTFGSFRTEGYSTLQADIIIGAGKPTYAGLGVKDSGLIRLYTYTEHGVDIPFDSVFVGSLPCTLLSVFHSNVGDTLIREFIKIGYSIHDTLGDTAFSVTYPITYNIKLK